MANGYTAAYYREKADFEQRMVREGFGQYVAPLLRASATATRLAVASCSGYWPADNGQRKTKLCAKCGCGWVASSFTANGCPDCTIGARIDRICAAAGLPVEQNGDPRGAVVKVQLPSKRGNSWGDSSWLCVPSPEL